MLEEQRFVSRCCKGEYCFCGKPAEHKVEETIFFDDPIGYVRGERIIINRQPLTAYICHDHFIQIMSQAVDR